MGGRGGARRPRPAAARDARRAVDEGFMRRCLALAARSAGRTAPNPMVGCVVVGPDGAVLAEGRHRGAGRPHAEADALARLGWRAPGATLYVNLEPCDHHGRTPPCAPLVAASGVARVVIGMRDPILDHAGGARRIAKAGIAVEVGVLEAECRALNRGFLSVVERGRPFVTLKAAATLDGAVATAAGDSRWITGAAARADGHRLRDELDAILVGVGTVLADDPALTCRRPRGRDPIRVVVDAALRTPPRAALLPPRSRAARGGRSSARVVIATSWDASEARARKLAAAGAEIWRLPSRRGRIDLAALCRALVTEADVMGLLVEGGPTLHRAFLDAGLADELVLYLAPRAVAGGLPWLGGPPIEKLAGAVELALAEEPVRLGDDLRLVYRRRQASW